MLGWDISVYTSDIVYPEGASVGYEELPKNRFETANQIITWSNLDIGGLTALIPHSLEPNITVLNRSGYPCLFYAPFGLIKDNFPAVKSCLKPRTGGERINNEKIRTLKDDDYVYVEAWDQS